MTMPTKEERHGALWALGYGFVASYVLMAGLVIAHLGVLPSPLGWRVVCIPAAILDALAIGPLMYRLIWEPTDAKK